MKSRRLHSARGMLTSDCLFVRGRECMWVRRSVAEAPQLVIDGPGRLRRVGTFDSERDLQDFERELRERLVHEGWLVERLGRESVS